MLNVLADDQLIHDSRIIYPADACPNVGNINPNSSLNMVKKATNLYENINVGIGLDFNSKLILYISAVRCN